MRSPLLVAALPLFSLAFASACASTETPDELAGETAADDVAGSGKADASVDGVYTYFEIAADARKCASPMCGGYFVARLNRSTTVCHDGSVRAACYAPVLDWAESGLTSVVQQKLVDASDHVATAGVRMIVRGRFAPTNTSTPIPTLGRFVVTEAWINESTSVASGVFVKVKTNGVRCIAAPCADKTEKALNTTRYAAISDLDFADADLTEHQLDGFTQDLFTPGGIIVAGTRYTVHEGGLTAKGRTATAAFHRLANPVDPTCFVGGCSGEVCADHDGVITTCDFHPEDACYHTASCQRQEGGQCGWSSTPELAACLGN